MNSSSRYAFANVSMYWRFLDENSLKTGNSRFMSFASWSISWSVNDNKMAGSPLLQGVRRFLVETVEKLVG